jgi:hypothetical protein
MSSFSSLIADSHSSLFFAGLWFFRRECDAIRIIWFRQVGCSISSQRERSRSHRVIPCLFEAAFELEDKSGCSDRAGYTVDAVVSSTT